VEVAAEIGVNRKTASH
jgi:transposase